MDVPELQRERKRNLHKRIRIYNPDREDFTCKYDNQPYTIRAGEIQEFPYYVAEHIKTNLANHIFNQRGPKNGNVSAALEEIKNQIEVEL